jgi:hypothetical protein
MIIDHIDHIFYGNDVAIWMDEMVQCVRIKNEDSNLRCSF